ncbi:MAG: outer membrane beta-barrel protein [Bacteroidota bacterium]
MLKIIFILLFVSFSAFLFSQKTGFGPDIGLTFSRAESNDFYGNTFKPGFNGGFYFEYTLSDKFSIRSKICYTKKQLFFHTQKKSTLDSTFFDELDNYNLTDEIEIDTALLHSLSEFINLDVTTNKDYSGSFDYFELPINFVYSPHRNFDISAGFYIAYMVNAFTKENMKQYIPALDAINLINEIPLLPLVIKGLFSGYFGPEITSVSNMDMYNRFDYGITASMTYKKDFYYIAFNTEFGITDAINIDYFTDDQLLFNPDKYFLIQLNCGINLNKLLIREKASKSMK